MRGLNNGTKEIEDGPEVFGVHGGEENNEQDEKGVFEESVLSIVFLFFIQVICYSCTLHVETQFFYHIDSIKCFGNIF